MEHREGHSEEIESIKSLRFYGIINIYIFKCKCSAQPYFNLRIRRHFNAHLW